MFEMSKVVEIWIIVGLCVLGLLFVFSILARLYRKLDPTKR